MDEASGEALRQLHSHIAGLEREKGELVRNSVILIDLLAKVKEMEEEVAKLREELRLHDEIEEELQEDLRTAQEQIELLNTVGAMDDESRIVGITAVSDEQERQRQAEENWEKERKEVMSLGHLPLPACTNVIFQLETKLTSLRHHADNIASLQQELKSANDSVKQLQQDIRQRDSEL